MTERATHRISGSPGRDLAEHLRDIANRVQRLGPNRRDPERFHVDKAELVAELRRLATNCTGTAR
jgi:hypothetical protein